MKTQLTITIEEEELKVIRHFSEVSGVSVSKLFQDHSKALCNTIKMAGLDQKKKYTKIDMMRMLIKGMGQPIS